jgi:ribosomal protein S5
VVKKNKAAAALGQKGGKAGTGKAKARTTEQARAAALKRWEKHYENATRRL